MNAGNGGGGGPMHGHHLNQHAHHHHPYLFNHHHHGNPHHGVSEYNTSSPITGGNEDAAVHLHVKSEYSKVS